MTYGCRRRYSSSPDSDDRHAVGRAVSDGLERDLAEPIGMTSLLLLVGQTSRAGAAAGTVTGIVQDALERPLAGTAVRLESSDGQVRRRVSTDDEGRFTFADVPAGTYAVFAEREGFVEGWRTEKGRED